MNKKLKIVHVMSNSPFAYPIPISNQGGTEKAFYDLTEALVRKGHTVYVFAPKGSVCSGKVIEYPSWLKENQIGRFVAGKLPFGADIINDFTFSSSVKRRKLKIPTVSTHQCPTGLFTGKSIFPSMNMRERLGRQRGYVVYNGINPDEYEYTEQKKDYLFCIGRITREKGVLEAMRVAQSTNQKLVIAGPVKDEKLFREEIEPVLRENPNMEFVGPVGGSAKRELFKNARCLLFPIKWEEPFGLVMIEAMISGTPVLAFNYGSVPEVLARFPQLICHDIDDMIRKAAGSDFPSPEELRHDVMEHYSNEKMAEQYVRIYRNMIGRTRKKSPAKTTKRPRRS